MVTKEYIPRRGDLVWINFNPTKGHEQSSCRPAIVLSPKTYNVKSSLIVVCPITSKIKGYPFEVQCSTRKISGAVLSDQIRTVDWKARPIKYICESPSGVLENVCNIITKLIL